MKIRNHIKAFRASETGATIVEFAIVFPIMLGCFAAVVESSRIYWNYQAAVTGVRDATRYLGRVTPEQICTGTRDSFLAVPNSYTVSEGGTNVIYKTKARNVIIAHLGEEDNNGTTLPIGVTVPADQISVQYACIGASLRASFTPVIKVDAQVVIDLPFAELFKYFGAESGNLTTSVVDQSRVFGI